MQLIQAQLVNDDRRQAVLQDGRWISIRYLLRLLGLSERMLTLLGKENVGIAALPTVKINGSDKQMMSFAGSKAIAANPNCKYPEVAVALAAYLGSAKCTAGSL
jgi:hypothetical protein